MFKNIIYHSHVLKPLLFIFVLWILGCANHDNTGYDLLLPDNKKVEPIIDGIRYESGDWEEMSYEKAGAALGNHRAVVTAPADVEAVWLHLPWRRRDENPDQKRVVIINVETGKPVSHLLVRTSNQEYADILFEPDADGEDYYVYYFPFETTGGYYPTVEYLKPDVPMDDNWLNQFSYLEESELDKLPKAEVTAIQSVNDFHSFFPMEVAATQAEVDSFISTYPGDYILFPEFRENPTRMTRQLPFHWIKRGLKTGLSDKAKRGEFYVFQIVVFASLADVKNLSLHFTDLEDDGGNLISKDLFQCINLGGIDLNGVPFEKRVDVGRGRIQPLWIGIEIPEATKSGSYEGLITVKPEGLEQQTILLSLDIEDEVIEDHGDNEPEKMSRLRWLNSTLGSEDDFIIPGFIPVSSEGKTLKILGREIDLSASGFPSGIRSYFTKAVTGLKDEAEDILGAAVRFDVVQDGQPEAWVNKAYKIESQSPGRAEWTTTNESSNFHMELNGILEYDGMLNVEVTLTAKSDLQLEDIKLSVPYAADAAKYILGLGNKGSTRPDHIDWKWEVTNHHEGVWLGNVNKGLQYVLRDKHYERPLNTNFYQAQPLKLPDAWYNHGEGGIRISESKGIVLCENYSGPRKLVEGESLNFQVRFLLTPFKTIDTETHFKRRFVHKFIPVDEVIENGGSVVNVHHANEINPYINYPFYNLEAQKAYIDEAHSKGIKFKLYNTIRELTYKCYELFPMRSLGFEIFNDGEGGGHPWLQEHLENDYHKAWHAWRVNDAAILNKGTSRWTNYYIEGLNWLAKHQEIDGLYLDDIAFSRETVKRMVAVLYKHRDEVVIDLHSANQFNERDGFINSAFLYMEHFPYVSRLWFGEYFEYDRDPDYWLTEVSGIPFGLMGEMLQDGGHPYRGMVYGMTTRVYGNYSPKPIWKLFDDFGIMDSEMIGYWVESVPVKSNHPKVPVTVYKREDSVLLALGSWSNQDELIDLEIDWSQMPFNGPGATAWNVPEVEGLQNRRVLEPGKPFTVKKEQGLFVIIQ